MASSASIACREAELRRIFGSPWLPSSPLLEEVGNLDNILDATARNLPGAGWI